MVAHWLRRLYYYDAVGGLLLILGHNAIHAPYKMIAFAVYIVIHLILLGKALHKIELADREATIAQTIKTIQSQLSQDAGPRHQVHD